MPINLSFIIGFLNITSLPSFSLLLKFLVVLSSLHLICKNLYLGRTPHVSTVQGLGPFALIVGKNPHNWRLILMILFVSYLVPTLAFTAAIVSLLPLLSARCILPSNVHSTVMLSSSIRILLFLQLSIT